MTIEYLLLNIEKNQPQISLISTGFYCFVENKVGFPLPDLSRGQASWAQAGGTSGDFDYDLDYLGRDC